MSRKCWSKSQSRSRSAAPRSKSPMQSHQVGPDEGYSYYKKVPLPDKIVSGYAGFEGFNTSSYRFLYRDKELTR